MTAIQADFVNYKRVASRKVVQLIFEVPEEMISHALGALGLPNSETNLWCGIARINLNASTQGPPEQEAAPANETPDEPFRAQDYEWRNPEARAAE